MVGQAAARRLEGSCPVGQRGQEAVEGINGASGHDAQPLHPFPGTGVLQMDGLVRAEGGQHLHGKGGVVCQGLVPAQVVGGVVGSAQGFDAAVHDKRAGTPRLRRQQAVACLPDAGSAFGGEQLLHAKVARKLQLAPVIQRVTHAVRHRVGPAEEFLIGLGAAGYKALLHAVGAHQPPLVMIAS